MQQSRAKHATVRHTLEQRVREMAAGEGLPSERELSAELGVARMTLRRAVDALVADGLLTRRPGAGTFVSPRRVEQPLQATSFSQDMRERGLEPGSHTLQATYVAADVDLAERLGIEPGDDVFHPTLRRRRCRWRWRIARDEARPGLDGAA